MTKTVIIVGGYGVFGGKIAQALAKNPLLEVVIAGRNATKAQEFCRQHGGRPLVLDRNSDEMSSILAQQSPFLVIDAAGPFQAYLENPYALAKAAISCGAHYLDLSDDADFTAGIRSLDAKAQSANVCVLSGVSSVPAISSAAVEQLSTDITDIHLIESIILPGNRAPRGTSVIRAILSQIGQRIPIWRAGEITSEIGWSGTRKDCLKIDGIAPLGPRWSSLIGAPDLKLFPVHYTARSVSFRAGLELSVMHLGLNMLGWLVKFRLLRSIEPLTRPLKWIADKLDTFGSDRGGMQVRVLGITKTGETIRRDWTLIAEAGDGPHIPALAARVICQRLLDGQQKPGARPCLGEFTIAELEQTAADLNVTFGQTEMSFPPLFSSALESEYTELPRAIRDLHCVLHARQWVGKANIKRGQGSFGNLICSLVGFPASGHNVPVNVSMLRSGNSEHWIRDFGGKKFRSTLSLSKQNPGVVWERFGLFSFEILLERNVDKLEYPVRRGTFLGLPWPSLLMPKSVTHEAVDEHGRVTFDVAISLPIVGPVIHYQGWLISMDNKYSTEN